MGLQFTSIYRGLNLDAFQESKEDFLEKGRSAQIGEIRVWHGKKFQKQPNGGWIPVKQGTKESKKEGEIDWKKMTKEELDKLPTGTKISYEDELSGETIASVKQEDGSWKDGEGNRWSSEEVQESVSHPDTHGHKMEKLAEGKKEKKELTDDQKRWLDRFFDPSGAIDWFLEHSDNETYPNKTVEEFEKFTSDTDEGGSMSIETIADELNLSIEEATAIYKERQKKMMDEVKEDPEKYGFDSSDKTSELNEGVSAVKDWIGNEVSDQEISDVLDGVADFVPDSMLKISARNPMQFGEMVYDRADEIMKKYREHFDHWDGTDVMPDEKLKKILVAVMYDKANPRA